MYFLLALVYLWADANGLRQWVVVTKPLLVTTLLVYFWRVGWRFRKISSNAPGKAGSGRSIRSVQASRRFGWLIMAALLCSIAGDSFLLFSENGYFIHGLGSFLLTHVFYSWAFLTVSGKSIVGTIRGNKPALVVFLLILMGLMTYLWPDLGGMRWPVLIYGVAIVTMGWSVAQLRGIVHPNIFWLLLTGAVLFMFSDSMIALEKFKSHELALPYPRLLIMVPYILAQFLIVRGAVGLMSGSPFKMH